MVELGQPTYRLLKNIEGEYQFVHEVVPQPGQGEVLVKVAYSTFNPIDRYQYFLFKTEHVGSDGSGTVVQVGEGVDNSLIGKKVAFLLGAWAEYRLVKKDDLMVLDDSQDLSKAANAGINPVTAVGLLELAQERGAKAIIQTAASSQLGKQINKLFQKHGIQVINVVRREELVKQLKEEFGFEYALNQNSETFFQDLKLSIKRANINISGDEILFKDKSVRSFLIFHWLTTITQEHKERVFKQVADDLKEGGLIFGSNIVKEITLDQYLEGFDEQLKVSADGKILVKIQ
eukprot:403351085